MFHKILIIVVIAFAMGVVGCRSCLSPYDLCQPTFVPANGDRCMGELYRSGSVLGGNKHLRDSSADCQSCSGEITPDSSYYMNSEETVYNENEAFYYPETMQNEQAIDLYSNQSEPVQQYQINNAQSYSILPFKQNDLN
ncbi:MAG: hypothetical protein Q4C95_05955 [Planctomycetia bacterium]|nr:hypothetical protein [Planctomycetia bacterium]